MSSWAFVFPGQGAQQVGMGRALAEACPESMAVWEQAERALAIPVRDIAWEGTADELARTDVTQPALLTADVAALRAIESRGVTPCAAAGHSLGEYAALVAVNTLSFEDAVRVVRARGVAMQRAAESAGGGMAAVIGGDGTALATLCDEIGGVAPANLNAPGQVVVSGTDAGLDALEARAKEIGARRVLRLNVAGPFHSPAMAPAAEAVATALQDIAMNDAAAPVYTNVSAKPQSAASVLREHLVAQVTGRVLWSDTIEAMVGNGITRFVELGPGAVLAGLIKRIQPDAVVYSVGDPDALSAAVEGISS